MSILFNEQVRAILQEAATKLGALDYYARIEPGRVPVSGEGVLTLNVASSLEGLARIETQTTKLVLLKYLARSLDRSEAPDFVAGVVGPNSK